MHEVHLNRFGRTHPRIANKGTVAHDEYMELGNRLFAMFPKMRSLKGYIRSGTYVGLAQKNKEVFTEILSKHEKDNREEAIGQVWESN